MNASQANSYSAKVTARLRVGDRNFEVASVGPLGCRRRSPESMPPSEAEMIVTIDGSEKSQSDSLTDGIAKGRADIRFETRRPVAANE